MATLGGLLTEPDDANVEIKSPTLNATKVTWIGAAVVAIGAPILTWIGDADDAVRQAALMITMVALPSVALIVAVDVFARAYVQSHKPAEDETAADSGQETAPAFVMAPGPVRVKVSGKGDAEYRLLGARWDPKEQSWRYWVGRPGDLAWIDEKALDEYVSG